MRNNGGFTLIELILVMVIIGILAGAVTLNLSGRVGDAQTARVQSDLKTYESAVAMYALDNNDDYPKSLEDLVGGERDYVTELKKDPWGNDYVFKAPGRNGKPYDLFSRGKDEQAGTEDDISIWDAGDVDEGE